MEWPTFEDSELRIYIEDENVEFEVTEHYISVRKFEVRKLNEGEVFKISALLRA